MYVTIIMESATNLEATPMWSMWPVWPEVNNTDIPESKLGHSPRLVWETSPWLQCSSLDSDEQLSQVRKPDHKI